MSRQDRQGVRTPAALEQKYDLGKTISDQNAENAAQNKKIESLEYSVLYGFVLAIDRIEAAEKRLDEVEKLSESVDSIASSIQQLEQSFTTFKGNIDSKVDRLSLEAATHITSVADTLSKEVSRLEALISSIEERVLALES
jgi:hypothetical protein